MNTQHAWSLRDYWLILLRFKWRALSVFLGALLLGLLWLSLAPQEFESNAKLLVRVGRENAAMDPALKPGETISLTASREAEMNSILEHLRSRCILEKVLAAVEPGVMEAAPQEKEAALKSMKQRVRIRSPRSSTVITVQGKAESPREAQQTVAALVDVYLDDHMRINRPPRSYEFFVEQSNLLKDQLETAQAELRDAKNRAGMASIEGRRTALERQASELESQIQQVSANRSASEAKIAALEAEVASLPEALLRQLVGGEPDDGLATMRQQLFQLRIREQEVLSKFTSTHPVAMSIRDQVHEVEGALKHEAPDRRQIIAALSAREVANRASLEILEEKLQSHLAELNLRLVTLNRDAVVIDEFTRKVERLEARYLTYLENMEEARMDQALQADRISNVNIIQPATLEPTPVSPRKALTLFLAALGGLMGTCLVVFVSVPGDPTVTTSADPGHGDSDTRPTKRTSWRTYELPPLKNCRNGHGLHAASHHD